MSNTTSRSRVRWHATATYRSNEGHVVDNILTFAAGCVLRAAAVPLNLLDICAALIREGFPAPNRESLAASLGPVLKQHREAFACRDGRWTMAL